jgi:S-adenosylmethionine synthetase
VQNANVVPLEEITTNAVFNYYQLARKVICEIGYDSSDKGFDSNSCGVLVAIAKQSGGRMYLPPDLVELRYP